MGKEIEKNIQKTNKRDEEKNFQSFTLLELSLYVINQTIYNTWRENNKRNVNNQCCLTSRSFNLEKIYELDIPSLFKKMIHSTLFKTYNRECWDCEAEEYRYQIQLKSKS
jgi:hypothetical protein